MKFYTHILFDLDGTLTDSKPGIINAALYALDQMKVKDKKEPLLHEHIGLPLQDYFRLIYPFSEEEIKRAVIAFRAYYGDKGVYENHVYPGITELLHLLHNRGHKIYISTAKYEKYAKVVIDHFGFSELLTDFVGADADGKHATKTGLAKTIISRNNIRELDKTIVIGDKHMDIRAGHDNKIDSCAVTYGFGSLQELEKEQPTHAVHTVSELRDLLCN